MSNVQRSVQISISQPQTPDITRRRPTCVLPKQPVGIPRRIKGHSDKLCQCDRIIQVVSTIFALFSAHPGLPPGANRTVHICQIKDGPENEIIYYLTCKRRAYAAVTLSISRAVSLHNLCHHRSQPACQHHSQHAQHIVRQHGRQAVHRKDSTPAHRIRRHNHKMGDEIKI